MARGGTVPSHSLLPHHWSLRGGVPKSTILTPFSFGPSWELSIGLEAAVGPRPRGEWKVSHLPPGI